MTTRQDWQGKIFINWDYDEEPDVKLINDAMLQYENPAILDIDTQGMSYWIAIGERWMLDVEGICDDTND